VQDANITSTTTSTTTVPVLVVVVASAAVNYNDDIPNSALLYIRHNYGTYILQQNEHNRFCSYNPNMQLSKKVLVMSSLDITDD
jgi:hypothetical protein